PAVLGVQGGGRGGDGGGLGRLVGLEGGEDTLADPGDDREHQPGDGGDGELAVPLPGPALAVEQLLEDGLGAGPLQDPADQDGQRADFDGGVDPGWGGIAPSPCCKSYGIEAQEFTKPSVNVERDGWDAPNAEAVMTLAGLDQS